MGFLKRKRWDTAYASDPPWDTGRPPGELTEMIESGAVKPCRSIDLGCGRGHTVRYLQSKGFDAWGIDVADLAVKQASEISRKYGFAPHFINADVISYAAKDKFLLAIDIGFYHTNQKRSRNLLASKVYRRYLQESGTLLLWCRSDEVPGDWGPNPISKSELQSFFSKGWDILEIRDVRIPGRMIGWFMRARLKPK